MDLKYDDFEEQGNAGVSVHAGFPNAATDTSLTALDITKLLIKRPASTFFMAVDSDAPEQGIKAGDIVVIDRALYPHAGDMVVWWDKENFAISKLSHLSEDVDYWGIVTNVIHRFHK